jgi:hypothetical protein
MFLFKLINFFNKELANLAAAPLKTSLLSPGILLLRAVGEG